ncbi:DNA primase [Borrelia miyamotoi]|uniref:DNA primase n=1 Tax=Borrelia miyamotoi TaxID=47466 RepID=A0AAX3JLL3_9SPIR|nr:DNA primase [Borrelia miyamotoi]QFP41665.1 DNA primase [Borrelia miyamotoi]QFP47785.1 DNA primase [Borrelia miyamotoi]QGT55545.1 DNA primase [Borrelia miyamotoi]QGT56327.1 DNA primase [Borrelia miyamotoi]WAZ71574.1 DNA primase [Borrelia miyamotoi]
MEYSNLIDLIKKRVDIVDFIGEHVSLVKSGASYKGLCPFHAEKTPSFSITPSQGLFYCFGCKKGGNVITFLMDIDKLDYNAAIKSLCSRIGIVYDDIKRTTKIKDEEQDKAIVSTIYDLNYKLIKTFVFFFNNNHGVLSYIFNGRGISREVIDLFNIGYLQQDIPNKFSFYDFLISRGYSNEILSKSGLFSKKKQRFSILSGRLIFPIRDFKGNVVGFGGRNICGDNGPKYINLSETEVFKKRELLYGFYEGFSVIKESRAVILTEGYIDVLAFFTAGVKIAVSPLGTAFSREHLALIRRYADKIIICFDDDAAGLLATFKAYQICLPLGVNVSVIEMKYGVDPADILKKKGASALKNMINNNCEAFEYLLKKYSGKYDLSKTSDLNSMIGLFITLISLSSTNTQRDLLLSKLESRVGVKLETLREDYYSIREKGAIASYRRNAYSYEINTYERYLVVALLKDFNYFTIIRRNIIDSDLYDVDVRKIFVCFENLFENSGNVSLLNLKDLLKSKYNFNEVFFEDMLKVEFEVDCEMVKQILFAIKKRKVEKRISFFKEMNKDNFLVDAKTQIRELMFLNMQRERLRIYLNE